MTVNAEIPKGTVIFFTQGEYSDYGVCGHFVAIEDLTKQDFIEAKETVSVQKTIADQVVMAGDLTLNRHLLIC